MSYWIFKIEFLILVYVVLIIFLIFFLNVYNKVYFIWVKKKKKCVKLLGINKIMGWIYVNKKNRVIMF